MGEAIERAHLLEVLMAANPRSPWRTSETLAAHAKREWKPEDVDELLRQEYAEQLHSSRAEPSFRYSRLPSEKTLRVLWAPTSLVGQRDLMNLTKDDEALRLDGIDDVAADVFVSHSHRDWEQVRSFAEELLANGIHPWLAETHIPRDEHIHDAIIRGLRDTAAIVVYSSDHALASRWVVKECASALRRTAVLYVVLDISAESHRLLDDEINGASWTRHIPDEWIGAIRGVMSAPADAQWSLRFFEPRHSLTGEVSRPDYVEPFSTLIETLKDRRARTKAEHDDAPRPREPPKTRETRARKRR